MRPRISGDALDNAVPARRSTSFTFAASSRTHALQKSCTMLDVVDRHQAIAHFRMLASTTCKKRLTLSACRDATGVLAYCRRYFRSITDCCQRSRP